MSFILYIEHENEAVKDVTLSSIRNEISNTNGIEIKMPLREPGNRTRDISISLFIEIIGGISSIASMADIIYNHLKDKKTRFTVRKENGVTININFENTIEEIKFYLSDD